MRYDVLIIFSVLLLWGFYWISKYKVHFHNRNWSAEEYFQHIKEKHPDIWEEYLKEDKNEET